MILTLFAFLPEIVLLIFAAGLLIWGVFRERNGGTVELPRTKINSTIGVRFSVFVFFMSYLYFMGHSSRFYGHYFYGLMRIDSFALFGKFLITLLGFLWMGFRFRVIEDPLVRNGFSSFEYPVLFLFSLLGGFCLLSSTDFLSAYLSLELQMLPLYGILAFRRTNLKSLEASFKYFVLGTLGSLLLLYGIALVYGYGGTTNFRELMEIIDFGGGSLGALIWLKLGVLFITTGLLFKLSLVPFHMWTPDVYEGSCSVQLPFIALVPKITALFLLIRLWIGPFAGVLSLSYLLSWIGAFSIVIGALLALRQNHLRRLMAYGSVAHMGFILMGISVGTRHGFSASIAHVVVYGLSFTGFFLGLISMKKADQEIETIDDLKGLWIKKPSLALLLMVMILSSAGLPPFAGFWTKMHLMVAALRHDFYPQVFLALFGALLSFFYYLRLLRAIFFEKHPNNLLHCQNYAFPFLMILSLLLTGAFIFQEKAFYYLGRLF